MYDVIVIGAGVIGTSVARSLMRFKRSVLVIDRASDLCEGTSKANSGIVHAGHDALPGSLKAKYNILGSEMMEQVCKELDVTYKRNGSLVIGFDEEDRIHLQKLYEQGMANGVKELSIIGREELRALEPNISDDAVCALYAKTGAIVCPFTLTIAMAENACVNGAEFVFDTHVDSIDKLQNGYKVNCTKASSPVSYEARIIVNAAGVYADSIHNMVCADKIHITARKGEYCLFDRKVGGTVSHTIFQAPTKMGKGVLVTPTVHGNLLVGPSANDIPGKEETNTTKASLDTILAKAALSIKQVPGRQIITSFAGLRAHEDGGDFIIGEAKDCPGFIDAAGIESPGLTAAPAIGEAIADIVTGIDKAPVNEAYNPIRKGIPHVSEMGMDELNALIAGKDVSGQDAADKDAGGRIGVTDDPYMPEFDHALYSRVICRCETVTEGEIVNSIRRVLGARTVDGVKRRVRAGMGRCQAGFCLPKTIDILSRELGIPKEEITKCGGGSFYLCDGPKTEDTVKGTVNTVTGGDR